MVEHMKAVAQQPQELTVEERNLLSVAYKNVIGSRRARYCERKISETNLINLCPFFQLESHFFHRAKRRRRQIVTHSRLQEKDWVWVGRNLLWYFGDHQKRANPQLGFWGRQSLLLQDERRLPQVIPKHRSTSDVPYHPLPTSDTWLNSKAGMCARILPQRLWRRTQPPQTLPHTTFPLRTQFVLVLHWTSPCSTMKFSTLRTELAIWPSKHLTMLLQNWTLSRKNHTKTPLSSCNCWETISLCGLQTSLSKVTKVTFK